MSSGSDNGNIWGDAVSDNELVETLEATEVEPMSSGVSNIWGDAVGEKELVATLEAIEVKLSANKTAPQQPRLYEQVLEEYHNAYEYAWKRWCAQPQCPEQEEEMEADFRLATQLEEELRRLKEETQ